MMITQTHLGYTSPIGLCDIHDKNAHRWSRSSLLGLHRHRFRSFRLCSIYDRKDEVQLRATSRTRLCRIRATKQPANSELSQEASKQSGNGVEVTKVNPISEKLIGSVTKAYPASDMQFSGTTEAETAAKIIVIQLERELKELPEEEPAKVVEKENIKAKYDSMLKNIDPEERKKYNTFPAKKRPFYTHAFALFCDALESVWLKASKSSELSPSYFLQGNFGPVDEFGPAPVLSVKGELPVSNCFSAGSLLCVCFLL
jgi:hypothetical protein